MELDGGEAEAGDQAGTKGKNVGWIYELKKESLQSACRKFGIGAEGTVQEMRARLSECLSEDRFRTGWNPASGPEDRGSEILPPKVEPPTTVLVGPAPMQIVRKWDLLYDNSPRLSADEFLLRLEENCIAYNLSRGQLLSCLPGLLGGLPLQWYRLNRPLWSSWDSFVRNFREMYISADYQDQLEEEIRKRTQGINERLGDFVVALCTLLSKLDPPPDERTQLKWIFRNIHPDYMTYIRKGDAYSIPRLLELGQEYELLQDRRRNYRPPPPKSKSLIPELACTTATLDTVEATPKRDEPPIRRAPFSREEKTEPTPLTLRRCWNCREVGHYFEHCPKSNRRFCRNCGNQKASTEDCSRCKSGNGSGRR